MLWLLLGIAASVEAAPCDNCFAVFIMPDTQAYTQDWNDTGFGPAPNDHLDLVTRYICANRLAWTEPATGKQMPILMVVQLGDMVQGTGTTEAETLVQWQVLSAAFENLDNCTPPVPYVLALGNHGTQPRGRYQAATTNWSRYFGHDRWADYACADPSECDWDAGEWFIGGGDDVHAHSRNHVPDYELTVSAVENGPFDVGEAVEWGIDGLGLVQKWNKNTGVLNLSLGSGTPPAVNDAISAAGGASGTIDASTNVFPGTGPPSLEEGRHRAALVRAPNGQPWLFIGLELAFDMPPASHPAERDDSAWIRGVLADYPGVHTVYGHHSMFNYGGSWQTKTWYGCDSRVSTETIWNSLVTPYPQVLMTLNANDSSPGLREDEWTLTTPAGADVHALFRNYAGSYPTGWANGGVLTEQNGWNAIAVFDADDDEIRIRSYRIDDTDADGTYDGTPADSADLDMDYLGRPPVTIPYVFTDTRPASLDNCPGDPNPDQIDTNADGEGNACDDDDDGDGLLDTVETGTGVFVSPSDTGTDPLLADTDGDRFLDFQEVMLGSDPNQRSSVPLGEIPALPRAALGVLILVLGGVGAWMLLRLRAA
jgi:hypothetical protein